MVQLNGAHMGDELTWEPLSALTLCGPVATDETVRSNIAEALAALCLLVTQRSATLAETGHSTFQPTEDDPAVGVIIDEVDEIVKHVPGAGQALEFLASKQRKSAVCLLLATQRAVIAALGGGAVRANMSEVLVGKVARATESRHATGAEKEIPDIREYAKGAPGYFQRWDPHSGHRHRAGPGVPARQAPRRTRLHETARRGPPPPAGLEHPGHAAAGPGRRPGRRRGRHRRHRAADRRHARQARQHHPDRHPARSPPRRPRRRPRPPGSRRASRRQIGQTCCGSWPRPAGTTASAAGLALGKSKTVACEYLSLLRDRGIAVRQPAAAGPARWHRAAPAPPAPGRPAPEPAPAPAGGTSPSRPSPTRSTTAWSTSTTTPGRSWNRPARSGTGSAQAGRI